MKIILFALLTFFLVGCKGEVDIKEINSAIILCKDNGGLEKIHGNGFTWADFTCSNGASFTLSKNSPKVD